MICLISGLTLFLSSNSLNATLVLKQQPTTSSRQLGRSLRQTNETGLIEVGDACSKTPCRASKTGCHQPRGGCKLLSCPEPVAKEIETAPRVPEHRLLLWCPEHGGWHSGEWFEDRWVASLCLADPLEPTHWLPVPSDPAIH